MYITQWWPPTRRSQWVHRDPMVFAKDVGIEIVDNFQRYCVIYINKTIQEVPVLSADMINSICLNAQKKKAPPFGFRISVLFILWPKTKAIVLLGYWGHLSISVFIMIVQISCWAWVWGGAFETDGSGCWHLGSVQQWVLWNISDKTLPVFLSFVPRLDCEVPFFLVQYLRLPCF